MAGQPHFAIMPGVERTCDHELPPCMAHAPPAHPLHPAPQAPAGLSVSLLGPRLDCAAVRVPPRSQISTTNSEAAQTSRKTRDSSQTGSQDCHTTDVCLLRSSSAWRWVLGACVGRGGPVGSVGAAGGPATDLLLGQELFLAASGGFPGLQHNSCPRSQRRQGQGRAGPASL